jgi:N-methylhydantoinase A
MAHLRVAVDIGGTFTDICILDEKSGKIRVHKIASTPDDPIRGCLAGIGEAAIDLKDVSLFSHGTTVATNALITRRLPRTAMVLTKGFRDVIEIRRGTKEDLWDTYKDVAPPYVRRRDRLTVTERMDPNGKVVTPLDEAEAKEIGRILRKRDVQAVAVCFINSYVNAAHELRMKEILAAELPGIEISTSSEVLPEIFEHERFSTTVANAALNPVAGHYCERLGEQLKSRGYKSDLLLLHSGGGVMTARTAKHFAARLAGSGIAAGAIASRYIATLCGYENSIGFDMGGTSTDISLAWQGQNRVTKDWFVQYGYPIRFPSIEVLTIGAGGGSLAWMDEGGSLRNGPQSAGANPGPACYGNGNRVATNTDANLFLGRLGAGLVGGGIRLDRSLAEEAVRETVAVPLKMEAADAAKAIIAVANANMADAVRLISISRGYDPRDFALVAFGGAGPLHGVALSRELSIPTLIVPPSPGITSAMGCLLVDIRHDLGFTYIKGSEDIDPKEIEKAFRNMEEEGRDRLHHEGVKDKSMILSRSIDMMYRGQWRTLNVQVGTPFNSVAKAVEAFHANHAREYNYRRDETPVDFFRLNLSALGLSPKAKLARQSPARNAKLVPREKRLVVFDERPKAMMTPIYARDDLRAGMKIEGPAVIEQLDSTTMVPPGVLAKVDPYLNLIMQISEAKR